MSPFPLTPLIAEVEQEKLSGNNLPDLVKGLGLNLTSESDILLLLYLLGCYMQNETMRGPTLSHSVS